ncbi:serine hydrolase [Paenibacillus gorillae]|uniref:serine hydrolase n=1 Tax=Paenibacillus gorillae TaxID=1243662 RepID=UPI0004B76A1E|nr:serine hydrolase [Paenibacillus gorillae]
MNRNMNVKKIAVTMMAAVVLAGSGGAAGGLQEVSVANAASAAVQAGAMTKAVVTIDGKTANWVGQPFVQNGTTMVPLREAAVSLGGSISWDQASQTVTIRLNGDVITQRSGDSFFLVNGNRFGISGPSRVVNGSLMVPLRGLMEAMRASLQLSQSGGTTSITIITDKVTLLPKAFGNVDSYLKTSSYSGMALVAKDGKVLMRKGYGIAGEGKLNRPDMKTRIASITKSFTAASIMQLIEAGKLSLDDPISKVASGIPGGDKITIHMLLSHTSGLPSEFTRKDGTTIEQTVNEIRTKKLEFEPGSAYKYSNCGYVLLAYVVEKLSGMSYADYVQTNMLKAAGMTNSGTATAKTPTNDGYLLSKGAWVKAPYYVSQSGTGTLYSTVDDLVKWDSLLRSGNLLDDSSLEAMYTPHSEKGYGYGWIVRDTAEGKTVFHNGSGSGFSTGMSRNLDNGVTVILLGNHAGIDTALMMEKLQTLAASAI